MKRLLKSLLVAALSFSLVVTGSVNTSRNNTVHAVTAHDHTSALLDGNDGVIKYTLYSDGCMYLSGLLEDKNMDDYMDGEVAPWSKYTNSITNLVIDNTVNGIGAYAFQNCTNLTSVTIGSMVEYIYEGAFSGCSSLTSLTIPGTCPDIASSAFENCTGLKTLVIEEGVETIGANAFSGCTALTSVNIPASVCYIDVAPFIYCSSLTSITVDENNETYDSRNNCNAIMDTETSTLIQGCQKTKIPDDTTVLDTSCFAGMDQLVLDTIPDKVTAINEYAFENCAGVTGISLPVGLKNIGEGAFKNCTGIVMAVFWNLKLVIGSYAFQGCTSLSKVQAQANAIKFGTDVFDGCDKLTIYTSTKYSACTYAKKYDIPYDDIDNFNSCTHKTTQVIAGKEATCTTAGLTDGLKCSTCGEILTAQEEIPALGHEYSEVTFNWLDNYICSVSYYCTRCQEVFDQDYAEVCQTVVEPTEKADGSITYTASYMLDGQQIVCEETKVQVLEKIHTDICGEDLTFDYDETTGILTIQGSGDMYDFNDSENTPWGEYKSEITAIKFDDTVTGIGAYAFADCTKLQAITLPANIQSIGDHAFDGCTALTNLYASSDLTSIGESVFYNDTYLVIYQSGNGGNLFNYAFDHCIRYVNIDADHGDVNGDGTIDVLDAQKVMAFISDTIIMDATEMLAADANQDGYVSQDDVTTILEYAVGK